ncbi:hypothetical protein [Methanogenium cariaci]|jgi:hypothetical protein
MSLTGVVAQAERRGETFIETDPLAPGQIHVGDVVSEFDHAIAHFESARAKIEDYHTHSLDERRVVIGHVDSIIRHAQKTRDHYRRTRK